ncbi:MinD/ParA family ATP-binding protein [Halorarius halobius]|uniref:MinD/ParA family ATP-binding protein n=1 Tax=Halorarius halobius TaxID=2962671 RepID=UPI0020CEAF31|nr:P-loop NTPase [Halorarius halobius]
MLAVTGGKGGVGKTTTAMGLAVAAARDGREPVVVDADLDLPDLAAVAGVERRCLTGLADGDPFATAPQVAGVTLVGASPGADVDALAGLLDRLAALDRPVVVDCPAGAGRTHGLALRAATGSVLVTRATRQALADAVKAGVLARRLDAPPRRVVFNEASAVPAVDVPAEWPTPVAVPTVDDRPRWRAVARGLDAPWRTPDSEATGCSRTFSG